MTTDDGATTAAGPDRREVLGAAGLAALGVSVFSLPRAASAASPGGESLGPEGTTYAAGVLSTFNAGVTINGQVEALAVDADQRIVVGGAFTTFTTADGTVTVNRLARVDRLTGARDTEFDPNVGSGGSVLALGIDGSGRILLGGSFTTVDGDPRPLLARVSSTGALDENFAPSLTAPFGSRIGALIVRGDNSVIIGGTLTSEFTSEAILARILDDGTVADDFSVQPDDGVEALALQTVDNQQRLLIGGLFTEIGGVSRGHVARLNADGTSVDETFNVGVIAGEDQFSFPGVYALAVQPADGKVLLGGDFLSVGGASRPLLARVNSDGTLDTSFAPALSGAAVYAIALQGDGRIVIAGSFDAVGETTRKNIARLNANGTLDTGFAPSVQGDVYALAIPTDGSIVLGGAFGTVDDVTRSRLARLT